MILYSIFAIALGLVTQYWMFVALIFFISFSIPIIQTTTMTMLQEKVQIEMQGRIFSLLDLRDGGRFSELSHFAINLASL